MEVEQSESALWRSSSVLLAVGKEAVAIDPGISTAEVERLAAGAAAWGARITHVLVTHADWDHVCGIAGLRKPPVGPHNHRPLADPCAIRRFAGVFEWS